MTRRSWDGLDVALFHAKAGATRAPASPDHRFGLHAGRPVRAVCRVDGRTHRRLQSLSSSQRARLVEHIEVNLDRSLSLTELAGDVGLSPSHLKTLFRRTMGLPVHQYVVRRRVERARMLLEKGTGTIAEVALEVGFADQSHLARWMRRILGVSPAEVRRRGR